MKLWKITYTDEFQARTKKEAFDVIRRNYEANPKFTEFFFTFATVKEVKK